MRVKFVEFIGPSGIGKSTLYDELKRRWNLSSNWVPFEEIYSKKKWNLKSVLRPIIRAGRDFKQSSFDTLDQKALFRGSRGFEAHLPYLLSDVDHELKTVVMDMIQIVKLNGSESIDRRFFVLSNIIWVMNQHRAIIEKSEKRRICIPVGGEYFASQLMHFMGSNVEFEKLVDYIDIIPIPKIVIHMSIPIDLLMERIKKRARTSTMHRGLNFSELELMNRNTINILDKVVDRLKVKHGSTVYSLDMSLSVSQQAEKVTEILEEF